MDFRVDVDFLEHPKTLHLLEIAGSDGLVWLLRLWSYTAKHRPDGVLCGMNASRIDSALRFAYESLDTYENTQLDRFKILCDSGWLTLNPDTKNYEICGWKEYQSWVIGAKERSESAKKAAKSRWGNNNNADAPRIRSAMRSAEHPHDAVVDAPSPSPSPSPFPKDKKRQAGKPAIPYEEIVEDLNLVSGKEFKHQSKDTMEHISARWGEGFRLEDFRHVHRVKVAEWGVDPKMTQYIRPSTLYAKGKFESYLNQSSVVKVKTQDQIEFEQSVSNSNRRAEQTRKDMEKIYGNSGS